MNSYRVGLVVPSGRPKYVKGIVPMLQPNVLAKCMAFSSIKLMGTKNDFPKFTCKPLESENDLNKHLRLKMVLASPGK